MKTIWTILGLEVVPVPCPFEIKAADRAKPVQDKPDNLVYYANRAFVQSEDPATRTFEDTRYQGQADRSGTVTRTDERLIERDGLDKERYMTLKPFWASGVSAQAAARNFRGKRGFSSRTLDKYWAAFSEAATPPPGR
jgi:hypothetical protein